MASPICRHDRAAVAGTPERVMGSILGAMPALYVIVGPREREFYSERSCLRGPIVPGEAGEGAVDHVTERLPCIAVRKHQPELLMGENPRAGY